MVFQRCEKLQFWETLVRIQSSILVKVSDVVSSVLSNVSVYRHGHVSYECLICPLIIVPLQLSVFNKVFEKLIRLRLSEIFTTNNVIPDTVSIPKEMLYYYGRFVSRCRLTQIV